jgi:hypothetical protein
MQGLCDPAMVDGMSSPQEPYSDPSGNTEAFQAFVNRGGVPEVRPVVKRSSTGLIVGIVVAVIVIAVVVWLALS